MTQATFDPNAAPLELMAQSGRRVGSDPILRALTGAGALTILLMLASLLIVLTMAAIPSIRAFGFSFVTSKDWRPNERELPKRGLEALVAADRIPHRLTAHNAGPQLAGGCHRIVDLVVARQTGTARIGRPVALESEPLDVRAAEAKRTVRQDQPRFGPADEQIRLG